MATKINISNTWIMTKWLIFFRWKHYSIDENINILMPCCFQNACLHIDVLNIFHIPFFILFQMFTSVLFCLFVFFFLSFLLLCTKILKTHNIGLQKKKPMPIWKWKVKCQYIKSLFLRFELILSTKYFILVNTD